MAVDESFKRPGSVPFKWEVQPGIPKQEQQQLPPPTTAPRHLALPPAARVPASCRRASASWVAAAPLSPAAAPQPSPTHRRSMSARFATSLALPFTRRVRRGGSGGGRNDGAAKDDGAVTYCLLYAENKVV